MVIDGLTTIGADTTIFSFASIGVAPQNVWYRGERTRLVIGNRNSIFQYATICVGTVDGGGVTEIGNDCMLMIGAHVAHDCKVGDHVVMVNYSAIAGHCTVGDHVTIGAQAGVSPEMPDRRGCNGRGTRGGRPGRHSIRYCIR